MLEIPIDAICRQPVTSICISLNSTILLVGTSEGLIHLYDIPSHQLLRSISTHKGMSISHIQTIIKPPDLVGHVTLQMQAGVDTKDVIPVKPVVPFQRFQDAKAREAHEVTLLLPHVKEVYVLSSCHFFLLSQVSGYRTITMKLQIIRPRNFYGIITILCSQLQTDRTTSPIQSHSGRKSLSSRWKCNRSAIS